MKPLGLLLVAIVLLQLVPGCARAAEGGLRHRWLFVMRDLGEAGNLAATLELLPRARAAGYTAIVLSDGGLYELDRVDPSHRANLMKLQRAAREHGLDLIPCVMPIGYSGAILGYDLNLAEGLPVKEALFVVRGEEAVLTPDPAVSLPGGGFEEAEGDRFAGWDLQDYPGQSTFADHSVVHSGRTSVRMENIPQADPQWGHCRFSRAVTVKPFRQYHISAWVRTEGFEDPQTARITVLAPTEQERALSFADLQIRPTQGWTEYHVVFNSLSYDRAIVYFGTWEGKGGRIWWDDVSIEEIGLHNVLRREGCPVTVRGEDGSVYQESVDYEQIRDPRLSPWIQYHTPPAGIRLMAGTRLREGARLRVSYYHSVDIGDSQVMCCLSDPKVYKILREQVKRVDELLHPAHFFMQHDEIRVGNWDKACQDRRMTPGQLLADNMRRCVEMIREIRPDAKVWVWSDMFDPNHNAVGDYYLVNGSWAGSWEGLAPEVGVVNWANHLAGKNLPWFAERGHEQVLAGYYDSPRNDIAGWLKAGEGLRGITGAMYTTWRDDYSHIEDWAEAAWGGQAMKRD